MASELADKLGTDAAVLLDGAPPRDRKRSDLVYENILDGIVHGLYPPESRLPTESDLAASLKVSRPVVREALARLREDDLIHSRQGSGSYVKRRPSKAILQLAPLSSLADVQRCFEFRRIIEGEAAALAAGRLEDDGLAAIEAAWHGFEAMVSAGELQVDPDFAFHLAVAEASGNRYFRDMLRLLEPHIRFAMDLVRRLSMVRQGDRLRVARREHEGIYEAIRRRDPEAARTAMARHLETTRRRLFEGETGDTPTTPPPGRPGPAAAPDATT